MGNRSSRSVDASATQAEGQIGGNGDMTVVNNSGVFLSNELQSEIVNSFQSEVLQTQWEKLQAKILTNHNERVTQAEARNAAVEEELTKWRNHNEVVQNSLDQKIDELKAKFADSSVAIAYDVGKLEEKIGNSPKFGSNEACSDVRISLTSCYNGTDDIRKCDEIVKAMERCAKQTIMA